jgi:hypothetical protein
MVICLQIPTVFGTDGRITSVCQVVTVHGVTDVRQTDAYS